MYQNQNEIGGSGAVDVNQEWRPLPILWVEDFQPEPVEIRLPGFHSGIPPWQRPSGEKCGKRLRQISPGALRSSSKSLPPRATLLSRAAVSSDQKLRP
jgi:hypothetical protein